MDDLRELASRVVVAIAGCITVEHLGLQCPKSCKAGLDRLMAKARVGDGRKTRQGDRGRNGWQGSFAKVSRSVAHPEQIACRDGGQAWRCGSLTSISGTG